MAYVDVTIDGYTKAIAMGSNKIRNIVEDKMDNAEETMSKILNDGMKSGGEDSYINGLPAICDDGTNYATYGTITRSTDTWSQGQLDATGGVYSNSMFQDMYGNCSKNNKNPDIIITTQAVYNSIWNKINELSCINSHLLMGKACDGNPQQAGRNPVQLQRLSVGTHNEKRQSELWGNEPIELDRNDLTFTNVKVTNLDTTAKIPAELSTCRY